MSTRARRIGVAVIAAVLFALLALFSGADRYSEFQPTAVRFVPEPFRADAALVDASRALSRGEHAAAADYARAAVEASPTDARGLAILGAARELAGDPAAAREAFTIAARLGNREPLTQAYWFATRLASGEARVAADHLDAILRSRADFAPAQTYLAMLENTPGGRQALAEKLRSNALWSDSYLTAERLPVQSLRDRAQFLAGTQGEVPVIGCERIRPMLHNLAVRGYRGEAERLATAQCPEWAGQGPIADPEFEALGSDDGGPFGWRRHATGDVRASRLSGDRARVELENRSSVTRLVLSQPVALAEGRYVLSAKVDGPGGQRVAVSLDCGRPSRPALRRQRVDREGWTLESQACADALLGIWLRPGGERVVLDRVDLVPAS